MIVIIINVFLVVLEVEMSKIEVPADPLYGQDLPPGLRTAIFLLCPYTVRVEIGHKLCHVNSYKGTNRIHKGSTLMT